MVKEVLDTWANAHGVTFEWSADGWIAMTESVGYWYVSTKPINGRDDEIKVHPTEAGCELEKCASGGHFEVLRLTVDALREELGGILTWFESWEAYLACGPGRGH